MRDIPISILAVLLIMIGCSVERGEDKINDLLGELTVEPYLELVIDEEADDLFGSLATVLADAEGQVYVTDSGLSMIRIYNANGTMLQRIGREGSGPGEFQSIRSLSVDDDGTIWTFDNNLMRITSFAMQPNGEWSFNSQISLPESGPGYPWIVRRLGDGFLIGFMNMERKDGLQQAVITLTYMNRDGTVLEEELAKYIEDEMVMEDTDGSFFAFHAIPFMPRGYLETGPDNAFYLGRSDSLRVDGYDIHGEKILSSSHRIRPRAVTQNDIETNGISRNSPAYSHIPDYHPAFLAFKTDGSGGTWFNLGEVDTEGFHSWVLLGSNSDPVLAVQFPSRFTVHTFRDGIVYGVYREEDGRQDVHVYRIP